MNTDAKENTEAEYIATKAVIDQIEEMSVDRFAEIMDLAFPMLQN